jgi:4-carboxymuconolactone decarboxylase
VDDKTRYQQGMSVRRKVLGDAHVERTLRNLTPLNDEFQDFITRYAWGETWTRPGLDHHTRSMITIAMLIALNREAELKMHLRAAFNNGVTRDELKELIMHSALYCGLPAANATMHLRSRCLMSWTGNRPDAVLLAGLYRPASCLSLCCLQVLRRRRAAYQSSFATITVPFGCMTKFGDMICTPNSLNTS